jgi:hypothetical protein
MSLLIGEESFDVRNWGSSAEQRNAVSRPNSREIIPHPTPGAARSAAAERRRAGRQVIEAMCRAEGASTLLLP